MKSFTRIALIVCFAAAGAWAAPAFAQPDAEELATGGTIDVGETGWEVKRPVIATACPFGCPWGELAEFVHDAMEPYGYDVVFCRNCNRGRGPGVVSTAAIPPELDELDARTGTTYRVTAPVDFGITASGILGGAYNGGMDNLRLIAKIEDPLFLLVAVKAETGITDLAQIRDNEMPVRILAGGSANEVLDHYGITRADIEAWGGSVNGAMGARANAEFDVIIGDHGTPFMNPEGSHWTILSQLHDLNFLDLPDELVDELAERPGYEVVTTKWGLIQGMDRPIRTVARSGEVIFAREDTPENAAYDVARAIDESRRDLMFLIRRYSIDPRTVYEDQGVPLHPGAERYYREAGYIE
ncbi:MAG: TAXI family TRAP transporter solute-binding subunit [Maricaulaceae bacterium]|jgi:TRAP-type uncharacterized transport system substrate-binding protein